MISLAVARFFDLLFLLLMIFVLLTWFPQVKWLNQPFAALKSFSEIFLGPFRRIIPPIGMVDISPIVAFIVWSFLGNFLTRLLQSYGL